MKITIDNYQDFKPSELIRSFKDHIEFMVERSRALGKRASLIEFYDSEDCLGCLGGHAVMRMANLENACMFDDASPPNIIFVQGYIAQLGDAIRTGSQSMVGHYLGCLYPEFAGGIHFALQNSSMEGVLSHEAERLHGAGFTLDDFAVKIMMDNIQLIEKWLKAADL